jgi:hypothetical protein
MVIAARVQGLLLNLEYNHKVCSDVLDRLHSPSMSQRDQELNVHHLNCICESMGVQQFEFEALLPKIDEKIRLTQNVSAAYTPQGSFNQPQSPPAQVQLQSSSSSSFQHHHMQQRKQDAELLLLTKTARSGSDGSGSIGGSDSNTLPHKRNSPTDDGTVRAEQASPKRFNPEV